MADAQPCDSPDVSMVLVKLTTMTTDQLQDPFSLSFNCHPHNDKKPLPQSYVHLC